MGNPIIIAIDKTIMHIEKIYKFEDSDFITDLKNTLSTCLNKYINKLTKKQNKLQKQQHQHPIIKVKPHLTEYNLFIKDKYEEIKKHKQENNTVISYNESKTILKDMAKEWTQTKKTNAADNNINEHIHKPKRITGYNLYYKRNVTALMKTKPIDISIMRHVSDNWCALDIMHKETYNIEAKEITKSLILPDGGIIK